MKLLKKIFLSLFLSGVLVLALALAGGWWVVERSLEVPAPEVEFAVLAGSTPLAVAQALRSAGVPVPGRAFAWWARASGQDRQLKAGVYIARQGDSLRTLLARLARGEGVTRQIRLLEGWTWRQIRAALAAHPDVRQTLTDQDEAQVRTALATPYAHLEGLFFPDTYRFTPGTSDLAILRMAQQAQARVLDELWAARAPGLPLASPYEALILASIIEKETGHGPERARIAGVFVNRLRRGMRLQTDPTVIYGMGEAYAGRIRTRDLRTDTPWNTYTRHGLPPTPIASAGRAALWAAVQPEAHDFLYFVSRGDGSSAFAKHLAEHNRNVRHYILGRP